MEHLTWSSPVVQMWNKIRQTHLIVLLWLCSVAGRLPCESTVVSCPETILTGKSQCYQSRMGEQGCSQYGDQHVPGEISICHLCSGCSRLHLPCQQQTMQVITVLMSCIFPDKLVQVKLLSQRVCKINCYVFNIVKAFLGCCCGLSPLQMSFSPSSFQHVTQGGTGAVTALPLSIFSQSWMAAIVVISQVILGLCDLGFGFCPVFFFMSKIFIDVE